MKIIYRDEAGQVHRAITSGPFNFGNGHVYFPHCGVCGNAIMDRVISISEEPEPEDEEEYYPISEE